MEELLIAAVLKREPLWNPSNKHYKNVLILKKLWEEVSQEVNRDEKTVRMKWKNLRTYFFREIRKLDKLESGDREGIDSTSSWQYFKQMMFLIDGVSKLQKDAHIDVEFNHFESPDEVSESHDTLNLEETASHFSSTASSSRNEVPQRTKRQYDNYCQDELVQFQKRKIEILEKDILREQDDDLLFFKSLLPYMKEIPLRNKLKLRTVIQDAILQQLSAESDDTFAGTTQIKVETHY